MSDLSSTLAEARDYFLEADFELAAEKFEAAKVAATAAGDVTAIVAAYTGLAEVAIQQKNWEAAVQLLETAVAATGAAKATGLVRARYMFGLARMAQGRAEEARTEFEAAMDVSRGADEADAAGVRGDIEDRLAQLDELESLEEEDLLEIAMEFGAGAAADEYGPGGEDDDEEDEVESDEGDGEEDEEEEEEEEDEGDQEADDDGEDEDDASLVDRRKRKAAAGGENGSAAAAAADNNGGVSAEKRARADAAAPVANGDAHAASAGGGDAGDDQE